MSLFRSTLAAIVSFAFFALLFVGVPALAFAQSYNYCNNGYAVGNYNCGPATLLVYVQVINQYNTTTYAPGNFTVQVSGNNPTPASFVGSLSGSEVTLGAGSYSVAALNTSNAYNNSYTPSYSQGCTGTLAQGEQATCVITESISSPFYNYPTPYPYPYVTPTLSCAPSTQTISIGGTATFTAVGGTNGVYNWSTPTQNYIGIGPVLNEVPNQSGVQTVTVTNGTQTATCTVSVLTTGTLGYPTAGPTTVVTAGGVYVTPTYLPALPNTGFAPQSAAAVAYAMVILVALAIFAFPYVRKAFAVVIG